MIPFWFGARHHQRTGHLVPWLGDADTRGWGGWSQIITFLSSNHSIGQRVVSELVGAESGSEKIKKVLAIVYM